MPELPEVETIKRQLQKFLVEKKIKEVFVYRDKMVKVGAGKISNIKTGSKLFSNNFARLLKNRTVKAVSRRAKYLIIGLSGNYFLMIHLRMSGQLIFLEKRVLQSPLALSLAKTAIKETLPTKHTHVEFVFSNGDKLFYNDTRQFGHIRLVSERELKQVLAEQSLGPEPLQLSLKDFHKIVSAHSSKRAKDFLLDQSVIAGIGNIYADESLFLARIHPLRKMESLKDGQIKLLHTHIKKVLNRAIKFGGSSLEYFLMTNGASGKFADEHLVYAKGGQPCPNCGKALVSKKIGSRTATFCQYCQK